MRANLIKYRLGRLLSFWLIAISGWIIPLPAMAAVCDINADGAVDIRDIDVLTAARNNLAGASGDTRDIDADGKITALDARQCVLKCTTPRCAMAPPPESVTQTIGTAGGNLQLSDGTRLEIPPNALTVSTNITLREIALPLGSSLPSNSTLAGRILSLEPHGQSFQHPVMLTIPTNPALLAPGFERADGLIFTRLPNGHFTIVGSETGDPNPESHQQEIDLANGTVTALLRHFSAYAAIYAHSTGAFAPVVASVAGVPGSTITIRQPLGPAPGFRQTKPSHHNCTTNAGVANISQVALPTRIAADITAILVHSTNGGPNHTFSGELGWGADDCNLFFAHYYIDRTGEIYQVTDDLSVVNHTANGTFTNDNAIGIEMINNVGEPYDGQQINALIRLIDYLTLRYNIPRPAREANSGLLTRNAANDHIITHSENYGPKCPAVARKCDPIGNFQSSDTRTFIQAGTLNQEAIPNGSAGAPSLLDMVVDALAVLERGRNHTGIITTAGGDSIGQTTGGDGGSVDIAESPAVPAYPGPNRANHQQLVVPSGTTVSPPLPMPLAFNYSDVIIAGRLEINQNATLNVSGSFYLAPNGSIVVRSASNGGDLTLALRGPALLQGLIDARGEDAPLNGVNQAGGNGGNVNILFNQNHNFLLPSIITRGGDTDTVLTGGYGGSVTITQLSGHLFVGGGTGPRPTQADTPTPPSRSDFTTNDPDFTSTFGVAESLFPRYSGDKLPPPPPFNLGTIGYVRPVANQRTPLLKSSSQAGFSRGILTSGGMGGAGVNGLFNGAGGSGGNGGSIAIDATSALGVSFRNADLITGGDVETTVSSIFVDPNAGIQISYRAPSGSLGGKAPAVSGVAGRGGDGGDGGSAGAISFKGTLNPAPSSFIIQNRIIGYTNSFGGIGFLSPSANDNPLDTSRFSIGFTEQFNDANGQPLYRLRLDDDNKALGGSGGIPGGKSQQSNFPGWFGNLGNGGIITGLPF